jgi:hypothetical protein
VALSLSCVSLPPDEAHSKACAARTGLREIGALATCTNLLSVELSFATSLADAWPLASCGKLQSASLTGCRALPLDSVARLGRAQPRANITG